MLPWVVLGVLCVCQALEEATMCYGSDSNLPWTAFLHTSGPVYFTPTSPDGPRILVRDKKKIMDSRYQKTASGLIQLRDVTKRDEGKYSVLVPFSNITFTVLTVTVKDCTGILKKVALIYGRSFAFALPGDLCELAFSPPDSPFQQVVLWNGTKAGVTGRGKKRWDSWELEYLTQRDSGYYTIRNSSGKFVSRTQLIITEREEWRTEVEGASFMIRCADYVQHPDRFTVTFTPKWNYDGEPIVLRRGLYQDGRFRDRLWWTQDPVYTIEISELDSELDSGCFEFRDENDDLALKVHLTVERQESIFSGPISINVFVVISLVVLVSCCCFVKKCCKKTTSKPDNSTTVNTPEETNTCQPAASNPIQYSGPSSTNQPFAPSFPSQATAPPYSSQPSGLSYPSYPPPEYSLVVDSNEITANVPCPQPEVCAGGGGPAPSFPLGLSSDSGTQLELGYSSAPLLSSDTPTYDTYTSDKMNFL